MEAWTRMFGQLQQGTKQRLQVLEHMQVGRPSKWNGGVAHTHSTRAHDGPCEKHPAAVCRTAINRFAPHPPQEYAQHNPMAREQLSALLDVSGQLLSDNNYKVCSKQSS